MVSDKDNKSKNSGGARRRSVSNDSTGTSGGSVSSKDPPPSTGREEQVVQVLRAAPVKRSKPNRVNARQLLSAMWRFAASEHAGHEPLKRAADRAARMRPPPVVAERTSRRTRKSGYTPTINPMFQLA